MATWQSGERSVSRDSQRGRGERHPIYCRENAGGESVRRREGGDWKMLYKDTSEVRETIRKGMTDGMPLK
jgi:hypothetical protein